MKTKIANKWILDGTLIYEGDNVVCDVAESDFPSFKDVEHGEKIVRAVNAYDALVEALGWYARPHRPEDILSDNGERAQAAIALAKEGQPLPPPPAVSEPPKDL